MRWGEMDVVGKGMSVIFIIFIFLVLALCGQ